MLVVDGTTESVAASIRERNNEGAAIWISVD